MGELKVRSALWVLIEGVAVGDATSETVLAKKASILSFRKVTALAAATGSAAGEIASAAAATGLAAATGSAVALAAAAAERAGVPAACLRRSSALAAAL